MSIADIFRSHGVTLYSATDASRNKVLRSYLLERTGLSQSSGTYVIFAAAPYLVRECDLQAGSDGRLAAFAAVRDYHTFFAALFEEICGYIRERYGTVAAGFADHSPFDEVHGAATAGLGMIGDNGLLITDAHSSFVVIGEVVCTLDHRTLESEGIPVADPDSVPRRCESCGRCTAACPTGAIGCGNKGICTSAVSQKKGELDEDDAAQLIKSPYLWGCDVCQTVCPHTGAARRAGTLYTDIPYFTDSVIPSLTESDVHAMPDREWSRRAYSWRERGVMLRNIRLKQKDGGGATQ